MNLYWSQYVELSPSTHIYSMQNLLISINAILWTICISFHLLFWTSSSGTKLRLRLKYSTMRLSSLDYIKAFNFKQSEHCIITCSNSLEETDRLPFSVGFFSSSINTLEMVFYLLNLSLYSNELFHRTTNSIRFSNHSIGKYYSSFVKHSKLK